MTAVEADDGRREPWAPDRAEWFVGRSDIGDYMHRWLIQTPWFTIRLHRILRSDEARAMHDHPWTFWTLLLSGGYYEITPSPGGAIWAKHPTEAGKPVEVSRWWPRWSLRRVAADQPHRLVLVRPVWTLVVSGPKTRRWGFHTRDGWLYWRDAKAHWAGTAADYDTPTSQEISR